MVTCGGCGESFDFPVYAQEFVDQEYWEEVDGGSRRYKASRPVWSGRYIPVCPHCGHTV